MDSHMLQQIFITYGRIALWVGDFAWQTWETIQLISRPSEWEFKDGPKISSSSCCLSRALCKYCESNSL